VREVSELRLDFAEGGQGLSACANDLCDFGGVPLARVATNANSLRQLPMPRTGTLPAGWGERVRLRR
jgi:hypothetical protein